MKNIKITNQDLFTSKSVDVNLDLLNIGLVNSRLVAYGTVNIQWGDKEYQSWCGEHGQYDFEEDFGFILVATEEN